MVKYCNRVFILGILENGLNKKFLFFVSTETRKLEIIHI